MPSGRRVSCLFLLRLSDRSRVSREISSGITLSFLKPLMPRAVSFESSHIWGEIVSALSRMI